jgi:tripartite-type tricarboxylate transporter receptor subunit TctC
VRDTLAKLDYRPFVEGPANFSQLLRKEHARWSTIVKETGFKPQ